MVRQKIRETVAKNIDALVSAAVKPAWAAMEKAVDALRPKIEPTIKEKSADIVKLEMELQAKMQEGTLSLIEPILDENVKPHLAKIVEVIKSPVVEAFDTAIKIFEEQCDQLDLKGSNKDEIKRVAFSKSTLELYFSSSSSNCLGLVCVVLLVFRLASLELPFVACL